MPGVPQDVTTLAGFNTDTTGSFTVTAGHAIYALLGVYRTSGGGAPPGAMSISDSQGLTWTPVISEPYDPGNYVRGQVWRAVSNGNSMTITITENSPPVTNFGLQVISIESAGSAVANVDLAGSTTGDPAPSLPSAPAATSIVIGYFYGNASTNPTAPTNHTAINTWSPAGSFRAQATYDAAPPAQSASWSTSNNDCIGILFEVEVGSIAYSITAAAGSYASTGTAAALKRGYRLVAAAGVFTLNGAAAALNSVRSMAAEAGIYTLAGTDAALRRGYTLAAEAASFLLSGAAATFQAALSMVANAGSYALEGTAAALRRALTLLAGSGSYTQDGTDAELSADLREFGTGPVPGQRSVRPRMERRVVRDHSRRRIIRP